MAVVITIAGVAKDIKAKTLNIQMAANGRATASFVVDSTDGSYRPAFDATVVITENGTTIFGGLLERPTEKGLAGGKGVPAITTRISAVDYNAYAERRFVDDTIPAGTLKAALTFLVANYFTGYGVTLHGSQVDGPSLPELKYEFRRADEVLNELMTLTADSGDPYIWRIDHSKVLRAYQPSTTAAPFNISGTTSSDVVGDIEVETNREQYANRIIVKVPSKTEAGRIESFSGDGSTDTFTLTYTPTKLYGHILVASGGGETLGYVGDGGQWSFDPLTNSITRDAGASVSGETYNLYFDGVFNGEGIAEDAAEIAAHGIWERVVKVESVPADTTVQALADAYLAKSIFATQTVSYMTRTAGVLPGQTQTINVSRRNINATAVIADVSIKDFGKDGLIRTVKAVVDGAQTNLDRGWRDVYKVWSGDKTGGSVPVTASVGDGGTSAGGPALPFRSVQFNNSGAFGGDAAFIYYKDENSLMVGGGGSSIDANLGFFESCFVFGNNCHIDHPA